MLFFLKKQLHITVLQRTLFQRHTSDNVAPARHGAGSFHVFKITIINYKINLKCKAGLGALSSVQEMAPITNMSWYSLDSVDKRFHYFVLLFFPFLLPQMCSSWKCDYNTSE